VTDDELSVPLREHLEKRMDLLERAIETRTFVTHTELEDKLKAVNTLLANQGESSEQSRVAHEVRADAVVAIGIMVTFLTSIVAIALHFIK
jgi:hypothetical protein